MAQILGVLALVSRIISEQIKCPKSLLKTSSISETFWSLHYWILDSVTAALMCVMAMGRLYLGAFMGKRGLQILVFGSLAVFIVALPLTYQNALSFLPFIGAVIRTTGLLYRDRPAFLRAANIVSGALWALHGALIGSAIAVVAFSFITLSALVGFIRHEVLLRTAPAPAA